jgi:hypothetical protein
MLCFVIEKNIEKYNINFCGKNYVINHNELIELPKCNPPLKDKVYIRKCDVVDMYNKFLVSANNNSYLKCELVYQYDNLHMYYCGKIVSKQIMDQEIKLNKQINNNRSFIDIFNYEDIFQQITYDHIYIYIRYIIDIVEKIKHKIITCLLCLKITNINIPICVKNKAIFTISNLL